MVEITETSSQSATPPFSTHLAPFVSELNRLLQFYIAAVFFVSVRTWHRTTSPVLFLPGLTRSEPGAWHVLCHCTCLPAFLLLNPSCHPTAAVRTRKFANICVALMA